MKGETFLRDDDDGNDKHLRIVISDPNSSGYVLVVGITTVRKKYHEDCSCILKIGDHSFIKQDSWVYYRKAISLKCKKLLDERFKGTIIMKEDIDHEVLVRIQEGARKSPFFPEEYKQFYQLF